MNLVRALVLSLFSTISWAQSPPDKAEAFFAQLSAGETDEAIDKVFAGPGIAELKPQAVMAMKSQVKVALGVYGKAIGLEKIDEVEFSPSLKPLTYLQKFEAYPVIWEFYFYRAKDSWVLTHIFFNDQVAVALGAKK